MLTFCNLHHAFLILAITILANLITWYIQGFSCSGINFSINSIYFSCYGSDNQVTTRIQLDHRGSLLFPSRRSSMGSDMGQRPNAFDPFPVEISKSDTQRRYSKGFKLANEENRFPLFPYAMNFDLALDLQCQTQGQGTGYWISF